MILAAEGVTSSDVFAITFSVIGFLLSLQGLWLVCRAMWPGRVEAAAMRCQRSTLACFVMGVVVTLISLLAARAAVMRLGQAGRGIGLIIIFFYVMISGMGVAGLATHIGRRLPSPHDAGRTWRGLIRGGVALQLSYLIPIIGWFGILPISLIVGAGAAVLGFFAGRPTPSIPTASPRAGALPPPSPTRELTHNQVLQ